jgi:hypothetical protein
MRFDVRKAKVFLCKLKLGIFEILLWQNAAKNEARALPSIGKNLPLTK